LELQRCPVSTQPIHQRETCLSACGDGSTQYNLSSRSRRSPRPAPACVHHQPRRIAAPTPSRTPRPPPPRSHPQRTPKACRRAHCRRPTGWSRVTARRVAVVSNVDALRLDCRRLDHRCDWPRRGHMLDWPRLGSLNERKLLLRLPLVEVRRSVSVHCINYDPTYTL
jgi:hypothetical protein